MAERPARWREGRVIAAVRGALHLAVGDGVVSLTSPGVPLMANAVRVDVAPDALAAVPAGARVTLGRRGVTAGPLAVHLPPDVPVAATRVPAWAGPPVAVDADALPALAARLTGRGDGLTPEGDDLLAGVALALVARGRAREASLLAPGRGDRRTTTLAAALVALAARGHGPEAAVRMLTAPEGSAREDALRELLRLGQSTGAALARGMRAVLDGEDLRALGVGVCRPAGTGSHLPCDIT